MNAALLARQTALIACRTAREQANNTPISMTTTTTTTTQQQRQQQQQGTRLTSGMKKLLVLVLKNGRSSATKSPVSGGVFVDGLTPEQQHRQQHCSYTKLHKGRGTTHVQYAKRPNIVFLGGVRKQKLAFTFSPLSSYQGHLATRGGQSIKRQ